MALITHLFCESSSQIYNLQVLTGFREFYLEEKAAGKAQAVIQFLFCLHMVSLLPKIQEVGKCEIVHPPPKDVHVITTEPMDVLGYVIRGVWPQMEMRWKATGLKAGTLGYPEETCDHLGQSDSIYTSIHFPHPISF